MFLLLLPVHVGSFGVACLPRQDVHLWVHTGPAHHPRHLSSPALPPTFSRSVIDPGAAALGRAALFSRAQLFSEPWRIYGRPPVEWERGRRPSVPLTWAQALATR